MNSSFDSKKSSQEIVEFLKTTYGKHKTSRAVVAVSGGVDSATSLTLVTQALGPEKVTPIFLPYGNQSTTDAKTVASFNKIPQENWREVNIEPMVKSAAQVLNLAQEGSSSANDNKLRLGNIMARCRMIVIYDLAKELSALVCGTENKSEKYLGYFTRFGDEASDIEPIQHLFKTEVKQLAKYLEVPSEILEKAPSAGLWSGQSDESELGFSYLDADKVLTAYLEKPGEINIDDIAQTTGVSLKVVSKVLSRVKQTEFKHQVPYILQK